MGKITVYGGWFRPHESRPSNPRRSPDAGLMLGQRRRRWPNIKTTSGERLGFDVHLLIPWYHCHIDPNGIDDNNFNAQKPKGQYTLLLRVADNDHLDRGGGRGGGCMGHRSK